MENKEETKENKERKTSKVAGTLPKTKLNKGHETKHNEKIPLKKAQETQTNETKIAEEQPETANTERSKRIAKLEAMVYISLLLSLYVAIGLEEISYPLMFGAASVGAWLWYSPMEHGNKKKCIR